MKTSRDANPYSELEIERLQLAMPERFDLVITDQTMPKLTGIELVAKIREIRNDMPAILCTGFSAGITRQKMGSIDIQALLNKPVLKREMAVAIRSTLDNHAAAILSAAAQPVQV